MWRRSGRRYPSRVETAPDHGRPGIVRRVLGDVPRSLAAVLAGTFTLRFSTGLTGTLLVYYLAELPEHGGQAVDARALGLMTAAFYASELILAPLFGLLSDRWGHHRVMQFGPAFGFVAVILTFLTTNLLLLGGTRILEGASTAAVGPLHPRLHRGDHGRRRAPPRARRGPVRGSDARRARGGDRRRRSGLGAHRSVGLPAQCRASTSCRSSSTGSASPRRPATRPHVKEPHPGLRRYVEILRSSHVWLLAPTWIALNAAIGLWTTQSLFQLVKEPDPEFADQFLMGRAEPLQVSLGFVIAGIVFFAGLGYWGERFRQMRRTTILFYGILGGAAVVAAVAVINHSEGLSPLLRLAPTVVVIGGLFVLAGATPAALGMLADISEAFPKDRGAIMGLYSVFLALGQIVGSLVGGFAAEWRGIDGILVATGLALLIALIPLGRLRTVEHLIDGPVQGRVALG